MTKRTFVVLTLTLALGLPTASLACGIEAWDFAMNGFNFTNRNWTFGEVFVPNQDLSVIFLGYYSPFGPASFQSPHPVGMFDAAGNLLASTVIDNNSFYGDPYQPLISPMPAGNFVFNCGFQGLRFMQDRPT